ncbi:MAG TPA: hypothetical protein EYP85_14930 [Armatimonadetes bacterium]|nr:hypothetical protein [Armatimonadota bacterium]
MPWRRIGSKVGLGLMFVGLAGAFLWPVLRGRVLLPADVLLVMTPWKFYAPLLFPQFEHVHNPMLDPIQQYYPWRHYAGEWLRKGIWPLWNPYMFCGTPFVANLLSAVFYPPNLLFLLVPLGYGFGLSAFLHLILAGGGMYGFLRELGLSRAAAAIGGMAFMLNGFFTTWLCFPNVSLWVFAWLPLVLLLWERARRQQSTGGLVLAGVVLGVQFLGGHLQMSFYLVIGFLGFALFRLGTLRAGVRDFALGVGLPLLLGGSLAALQLFPAFEFAALSGRRGGTPYSRLGETALPLWQLVTFLVPKFYGTNEFPSLYWGQFNYFEMAGYVGLSTLTLAAWAVFGTGPHPKPFWFFAGLSLFALLMAMRTPLYWLFYRFLPGFNQLAAPARILCLNAFALCALAAWGVESLLQEAEAAPARRILRFGGGFALLVGGAVLAATVREALRFTGPEQLNFFHPLLLPFEGRELALAAGLLTATLGLLFLRAYGLKRTRFVVLLGAVIGVDLFAYGYGFNPATDPAMLYFPTPETEFLQRADQPLRMVSVGRPGEGAFLDWMAPNTPLVYRIEDLQGSDSLYFGRYQRLLKALSPHAGTPQFDRLDAPLLDLLNLRYVLTPRDLRGTKFRPVVRPLLYENPTALPRAFALSRVEVVPTEEQMLARLTAPDFNPRRAVLVEQSLQVSLAEEAVFTPFAVAHPTPNRTVAEGTVVPNSVLVLSEVAYPGWRVYVNGKRQPLLRAYFVLRSAVLGEGKGQERSGRPDSEFRVEFVYAPLSFKGGLFVSLWAWAGIWACSIGWKGRGVRLGPVSGGGSRPI